MGNYRFIGKSKIIDTMNIREFMLLLMMSVDMSGSYAQTSANLMGDESLLPRWYYYGYNAQGSALFSERYHFGNMYTKNNKAYRLLHFERAFFDKGISMPNSLEGRSDFEPVGSATGQIGIRELNGRIFVDRNDYMALLADSSYWSWEGKADYLPYEQTNDGELIIYDFTKKAGDKFVSVNGHEDIVVLGVESLKTRDGISRNVQRLSNGCVVVEGIGCINSPGMWLCYLNPTNSPSYKTAMVELSYGDCFGNPVIGLEEVEYLTGGMTRICATPTIAYDRGRLVFGCETEGVEYAYEIKCADAGSGRGGEVSLSRTYEIRVRATLEGHYDSDMATATIGWRDGRPVMEGFSSVQLDNSDGSADVNGDGTVDVADIASVISAMASKSRVR